MTDGKAWLTNKNSRYRMIQGSSGRADYKGAPCYASAPNES